MSAFLKTPGDPGLRSALYLILSVALLILPFRVDWPLFLLTAYILLQPWLAGLPKRKLWPQLFPVLWLLFMVSLPVCVQLIQHIINPGGEFWPGRGLITLLKSFLIIYLLTVLRLSITDRQVFTLLHQWHIPVWLQSIIFFLNTLIFRLRLEFRRIWQGYESRISKPGWQTRLRFIKEFSLVYFIRLVLRSERNMQALFSRGFSGYWPLQNPTRPAPAEWLHTAAVITLISLMLMVP